MAAVKGKNTAPELTLRRALFAAGLRGWRIHYKRVPGTPDLAWPALKVAVFVNGAFWHGHPSRHKPGRSGEYWDRKIERNMARDREVETTLQESGWKVLRFWDFEVRGEPQATVRHIEKSLANRVRKMPGKARWRDRLLSRADGAPTLGRDEE